MAYTWPPGTVRRLVAPLHFYAAIILSYKRIPWRRKRRMKSLALLCGTAAMAFGMAACNQTPPVATTAPDTHDADVKAINDNEAQWNSDWAAKDGDKILAHYADDAVLMAPGMEALKGKDAIKGGLN